MQERERQHIERERPQTSAVGGADLGAIGNTAAQLLAAGDAAIDRALSGDSDAFLRANRQQGGQ